MSTSIVTIILLAVVQGLTEFLPVSSSGHLVIVGTLLGFRGEGPGGGIVFEVAVHIGTLGAVLLVYRKRVVSIVTSFARCVRSGMKPGDDTAGDIRFAGMIIVASIPAAAVGLLLHDTIVTAFDAPALASVFLMITGAYLFLSKVRVRERRMWWWTALLIGAAQAVAILPGCSRSGWTIATAMLLGLGYAQAAEFSFLLSVPAIIGALILELHANTAPINTGDLVGLVIGAAVAFLAGWVALRLLISVLSRGRLHRFSYYLIPAGLASLLYFTLIASSAP